MSARAPQSDGGLDPTDTSDLVAVVYDPEVDIDWTAPAPPDLLPRGPATSTLYGTRLWAALTEEQRRSLAASEAADALGFAYVAKTLAGHLLLRSAAEEEEDSARLRRTLAEIADTSRHLVMFARALEALDAPARALGPRWVRRMLPLGELLPPGAFTWAVVLLVNESLVGEHRELMDDPAVQPMMRMVAKIHAQEQERHLAHARAELFRTVGEAGLGELVVTQAALAAGALAVRFLRIRPGAYRRAGINPVIGSLVALGNATYSETLARESERLVAVFQEAGLIEGPLMRALWRHAGLMRRAT